MNETEIKDDDDDEEELQNFSRDDTGDYTSCGKFRVLFVSLLLHARKEKVMRS